MSEGIRIKGENGYGGYKGGEGEDEGGRWACPGVIGR